MNFADSPAAFWIWWAAAALLCALFCFAGWIKVTKSKEDLMGMMPWVETWSQGSVRMIGLLDLAGGLGIVLPRLTGILPWVSTLAAWCCVALQLAAIVLHASRKEYPQIGANVVFLILLGVVLFL